MTSRAAPRWRQLAPLALAVLAGHAALLQLQGQPVLQPAAERVRSFVTRSVVRPPAPEAAAVRTPVAAEALVPPPRARVPRQPAAATRPEIAETAPTPQAAAPAPLPASSTDTPPAAPTEVAQATEAAATSAARASLLAIPAPARLRYELVAEVRGFTVHGNADLEWRHDGADYEAKLALYGPLFPRREQRSSGRITAEGLAPKAFYDRSRGEQATHFDHERGRVTFSNNRPDAVLAAGAQDRLSVVLQLAALIGGQPGHYPPGTQIAISTASTREAEPWIFLVEAEEDLQLPGGAVRAMKLLRKPRKEFDQRIELWLAPRMDYAPVRLRLTNPNGDTVDQRWTSTDKG